MNVDGARSRTYYLVSAVVALGLACGGGATDPITKPTPSDAPGTPSSQLKSFTATPSVIAQGDDLTLAWKGESGTVTLSTKGGAAFASGRLSSGEQTLSPGALGYPTGTGAITYQARNSEVANPLEVTVTVNPPRNHAPTVNVTASAASCHPKPATPCSVTCNSGAADADGDALSYSWSGCASGSGSTASCTLSAVAASACSVTVTDGKGGSASGSAAVSGTNTAPDMTDACWQQSAVSGCMDQNAICKGCDINFRFKLTDDDPDPRAVVTCEATTLSTGSCTIMGACRAAPAEDAMVIGIHNENVAGGSCTLDVTLVDDWGSRTTKHFVGTNR